MEIMSSQNSNQLPELQLEGTTFSRTCINGISALSGLGLLSVPFALSEGGWLSFTILFMVASICWYTGLLLQRCMEINPQLRTYPDIGALAFNKRGRIIVSIFVYFELYLVAVELIIVGGDGLDKLFPNQGFKIGTLNIQGKHMFMMLTALLILPTTWLKNLGSLAFISFSGILASIVLVLCVAWAGAVDGVGFNQRDVIFKFQGLPTTVSLFFFCYCGHVVFPTLRTSMRNRSEFSKVLAISFVASTITYGLMAILGYLMYGGNIQSQITLNLPIHKINTKIAIVTTLINPVTKYAVTINPITNAIEDASSTARRMSIVTRTLLFITTLTVAMSIPFFAYVMGFIGAFLSITNSVLIPCLCYLKIKEGTCRFGWESTGIVGILVLGCSVGVVGTYSSIKEIVKRL